MNAPTPRTDAPFHVIMHKTPGSSSGIEIEVVPADFARQLERELIEANNELTEADRALNLPGCLVVGYALSDDDKKRYPALAEIERLLAHPATTPTAEQIEACATLETRAIANEQARDELHRILVMLKREMDEHVSDKTKNELPKAAWHSACDRANAVMANFLL